MEEAKVGQGGPQQGVVNMSPSCLVGKQPHKCQEEKDEPSVRKAPGSGITLPEISMLKKRQLAEEGGEGLCLVPSSRNTWQLKPVPFG